MNEDEKLFIEESIAHARSLPFRDCIKYLRGFLATIGKEHFEWRSVRAVVAALESGDSQLDLIELGQLKLKIK